MSEEKNIKQEDRFDELYRQSLEAHRVEPTARVWNRMNRQMLWRELLRFNFSNLPGYTWVIAAAVAVVVGIGIFWLSSGEPGVPGTPPNVTETQAPPAPYPAAPEPVKTTPAPSPATKEHSTPPTPPNMLTTESVPAPTPLPLPAPLASPKPAFIQPLAPVATAPVPATQKEWLQPMETLPAGLFPVSGPLLGSNLNMVPNPNTIPGPPDEAKTTQGKPLPQSLNFGANITPDMVFYKNTSSYFKYDYTLDAGLQYNFGRFYLQSGAGIAWSTDIGTYAISANRNDSIGYYYSVTAFAENPSEPGHMEYTTSMNTVYDTNQYLYDYSTRNTYTYLEIPLAIGFRAVSKPQWSLGVDAGGFWSCLLSSDEPPPVFYIPEGRITDIVNQTPARRKNSFGLTGSLRFEYLFGKRFSLMIAPTFKYHLNAIEENDIPGATQPWSVGLRAGIWYRFDLKK